MKKLILTGLSFLFAITLTFAQQGNPETKAKETVTELTEKLTLNEDQQKSIYDIVLEKAKSDDALAADTTLKSEDLQKQIETSNTETIAKIADVLTEEQKTLFVKYLEEKSGKKEEQVETSEQ